MATEAEKIFFLYYVRGNVYDCSGRPTGGGCWWRIKGVVAPISDSRKISPNNAPMTTA
jgi:hypothetical protein